VRQPANATNNAAARRRAIAISGGNVGRYTKHAIGERTCLAHEHVALLRFELLRPGCVLPTHLGFAAHDAGATGTTGSSRTFVRKIEALTQTRIEDRFVVATLR